MRLTEQLPGLKLFYFKPPDMESLHFIKSFKTLNFVRRVKYLKKTRGDFGKEDQGE